MIHYDNIIIITKMNSGIRPIVKYQYYSVKKEPETKTRNICNNVDFVSRTKREYFPPKAVRENVGHIGVGKHVEKLEKRFASRVQTDDIDLKSRGGYTVTRDTPLSRGGFTGTRDNRRASREITSTKEFEDRATNILAEMRKQRRSLKLESASSVSNVSSNLRPGGWRETMKKSANREDVNSKVCQTPPRQSYLSQKRSSISEFVGKVIRKLSVGKEGSQEVEQRTQRTAAQFTNPLDFILMKEEYLRKNPPPPPPEKSDTKKPPEDSMACVMDSLKKMVKKINPKREFLGDKEEVKLPPKAPLELRTPQAIYEDRMKKYQGAALTPFNSHSSKYNNPGDNKREIRERIQSKVLSSLHQPEQSRLSVSAGSCEIIEPEADISVRIYPVRHWKLAHTAVTSLAIVLSTVEFRRAEKVELTSIIAQFNKTEKKKFCHAKLVIHGLNDPKGERFCYALITRSDSTFATVRPINVAVKKKTELFAPKLRGRATVSIDSLMVAVVTAPGTCGTTTVVRGERGQGDRGCALFGRVGPGQEVACRARRVRRLVVSLPVTAIMDTESEKSDKAQFTKCDRVPQSQIVQMILSSHMGTLSRISFHHPPVFHYQDVVITIARFLRTKKDLNKFKFKQEEFISRVVSIVSGDDSNNKDGDGKFLSYGTV